MDSKLSTYLRRIGLSARPRLDEQGLEAVQYAHRQAIAFENLEIRLGRPIAIDSDRVFDKLVAGGRGGYCFEQNRLLADMLSLLGFRTRPLLARVRLGAVVDPAPRTHVLLSTEIGGEPWITDAGFGGSYVPALRLWEGPEVETPDGARHRLRRVGEMGSLGGEWLLERAGPFVATDGRRAPHDGWQPQYSFDLSEVAPADLLQANHWTSTSPTSRFVNLNVVSRVLPGGFASLVAGSLKVSEGIRSTNSEIADRKALDRVLREVFGLALIESDLERLPLA